MAVWRRIDSPRSSMRQAVWTRRSRMTMAIQRQHPAPGLVHPSERGSQYASGDYGKALKNHKMIASMSRKAIYWDNAPMERFFGSLKSELVHRQRYPNQAPAKRDLFASIARDDHRQRLHSALGYITPEQAELQAA
ncbi:MAG: DDE-type integrase/transposase/recombinase [Azospirillum sp.]|nr:DDE-type integrase/transposase/recombinase [Azospirillum sp.]